MIRLGINKRNRKETPDPAPPVPPADEHSFLYIDPKGRVRKRARPMRIAGNLLIVAGLLMLVGIGAWYGYQQWDNQQFVQELAAKGGKVDPPVAMLDAATPTATIPAPPPDLSRYGTWGGINVLAGGTSLVKAVDTSPPVHLVISSVKIDTKIVPITWKMLPSKGGGQKSEWQVADYAVGHHQGTANPGEQGNVVLSGHVDYKGEVFKNLHNVNKGDEVTVFTEKGQYIYVVTDLVLVKEDGVSEEQKRANAAYMNPTPDQTLTMITCWPYGIDDHRLIVIAKPYQSSLSTQSEYVIR